MCLCYRKQSFIGTLKNAFFYGPSNDRIVATTEENVLAVLSTKTGDILWRKVFEKNDRGDIRLLHVQSDPNKISRPNSDDDIITVSGFNPALVRGWNSETGNVEWEWSLTPLNGIETALWFYDNLYIYHVIPVYGSHLEVTAYYGSTGQQTKSTSTRIQASWIDQNACILSAPYFACVLKNEIIAVDLTSNSNKVLKKTVQRDMTGQTPKLLRVS